MRLELLFSSVLAAVDGAYWSNYLRIDPFPQYAPQRGILIRKLGGTGPYVQHEGFGLDEAVPQGCKVDQVHLLSRHGERFPTKNAASSVKLTLDKMKYALPSSLKNDYPLKFLTKYRFYADDEDLEQETYTGPYAGLKQAFGMGQEFSLKYGTLWDQTQQLTIYAASEERVVMTAHQFADGFKAKDKTHARRWRKQIHTQSENIGVLSLDESGPRGADSLTFEQGCPNYHKNYKKDSNLKFLAGAFKEIRSRLNTLAGFIPQNESVFTDRDLMNLMMMCGYELNSKYSSRFCDLFTANEWNKWAYSRDLSFYYESGAGNPLSSAVGAIFANATLSLLQQNDQSRPPLFFSFAHDTQLYFYLTALGLFLPDQDLPTSHIPFTDRKFDSSQLTPMLGRLVIERWDCQGAPYVRILLNDAVIPYQDCSSGPGFSCPLSEFTTKVMSRLPDYKSQCGITTNSSKPTELSFFWSNE